jgi:hypothetical protein
MSRQPTTSTARRAFVRHSWAARRNSAQAILAYGYDLGGGEVEWKIEEAGEYGQWETDWWDGYDFQGATEDRLLAAAGFTETDRRAEGYYGRKREANARIGVEVDRHCSGDSPMYMLVAHTTGVEWGDARVLDFAELEAMRTAQDWDAKLKNALTVLGMTPKQAAPAWLLVSYWG